MRVAPDGAVRLEHPLIWLTPYPLACGLLALSTCAYLAAVYLMALLAEDLRPLLDRLTTER